MHGFSFFKRNLTHCTVTNGPTALTTLHEGLMTTYRSVFNIRIPTEVFSEKGATRGDTAVTLKIIHSDHCGRRHWSIDPQHNSPDLRVWTMGPFCKLTANLHTHTHTLRIFPSWSSVARPARSETNKITRSVSTQEERFHRRVYKWQANSFILPRTDKRTKCI
jgi:hypothetical protein